MQSVKIQSTVISKIIPAVPFHHTFNHNRFFCGIAPGEERLSNLARTPPPSIPSATLIKRLVSKLCVALTKESHFKSTSLFLSQIKRLACGKYSMKPPNSFRRDFLSGSPSLHQTGLFLSHRKILSITTQTQFFCDLRIYI